MGGLGSAVADTLVRHIGPGMPRLVTLGIPDVFPEKYGSQDDLLELYGLQQAGYTGDYGCIYFE